MMNWMLFSSLCAAPAPCTINLCLFFPSCGAAAAVIIKVIVHVSQKFNFEHTHMPHKSICLRTVSWANINITDLVHAVQQLQYTANKLISEHLSFIYFIYTELANRTINWFLIKLMSIINYSFDILWTEIVCIYTYTHYQVWNLILTCVCLCFSNEQIAIANFETKPNGQWKQSHKYQMSSNAKHI